MLSCTDDPLYSFYIPIVVEAWRRLGYGAVICVPDRDFSPSFSFALNVPDNVRLIKIRARDEQMITYIQCARIFAAAEFGEDNDILITSDVDMLPIAHGYFDHTARGFHIYGGDLIQPNQYPLCYISARASEWRKAFVLNGATVTGAIDREIGHVKCDDMRGNYWFRDQETARKYIGENVTIIPRKLKTGKASGRLEREEKNLRPFTIDAHLPRPGYEARNLNNIVHLLNQAFPGSFNWVRDYANRFNELVC